MTLRLDESQIASLLRSSELAKPRVSVSRARCPFCHDEVSSELAKVACDACMGWHHQECWTDHGACSACGSTRISGATATSLGPLREGREGLAYGLGMVAGVLIRHRVLVTYLLLLLLLLSSLGFTAYMAFAEHAAEGAGRAPAAWLGKPP